MFSGKNKNRMVYRTVGVGAGERYGVGIMHKAGQSVDCRDYMHPAYVLVVLLKGNGVYHDACGNHFELESGMFFQRFPGGVHSIDIDPASDWTEFFFELPSSMENLLHSMGRIDLRFPVGRAPDLYPLRPRLLALLNAFCETSARALPRRFPEMLDLVQTILDTDFAESEAGSASRRRECLERAAEMLSEFPGKPDIDALCMRYGIGYENFRKLFREFYGVPPNRFRMRRRMDAAREMLTDSSLSVTEIAYSLGFSSPFDFSARFKRYNGYPPSSLAHLDRNTIIAKCSAQQPR
ncbi:MAG: AraC family transcriptional regulator [Victivallaceae bacterium]|nr:AraC family transcriptional regulator [Victivallaceae bacterium]